MNPASKDSFRQGNEELRRVIAQSRGAFLATFLFSVCINALMLTGPLFMLQVYDRVLGSGSEPTLVALFIIVAFLFLMMGVLDGVRGRTFSRIGARFQSSLEERVFNATLDRAAQDPHLLERAQETTHLTAIRRFLSSSALGALFDLPFTPLFLFGIALFHPYLGVLAVGGGALLMLVSVLQRHAAQAPQAQAQRAEARAAQMAMQMAKSSETLQSLGMQNAAFARWLVARQQALSNAVAASDAIMSYAAASKALRLFLQSAMLAIGAWLVLHSAISPGAMIASSILLGRALHPIDTLINQWPLVQNALRGREELAELLGAHPVRARPWNCHAPRRLSLFKTSQSFLQVSHRPCCAW